MRRCRKRSGSASLHGRSSFSWRSSLQLFPTRWSTLLATRNRWSQPSSWITCAGPARCICGWPGGRGAGVVCWQLAEHAPSGGEWNRSFVGSCFRRRGHSGRPFWRLQLSCRPQSRWLTTGMTRRARLAAGFSEHLFFATSFGMALLVGATFLLALRHEAIPIALASVGAAGGACS